jgi:hypothetical protein
MIANASIETRAWNTMMPNKDFRSMTIVGGDPALPQMLI